MCWFYEMCYVAIFVHHHIGFEAAAWYWHFVDVVWLFLFIRCIGGVIYDEEFRYFYI